MEKWVVCYDENFYPNVEAFDTEGEALARYAEYRNEKQYLYKNTTIYICKVIKSEKVEEG